MFCQTTTVKAVKRYSGNSAHCLQSLPFNYSFLNQVRTGRRPVCAWFLQIISVQTSVYVFVCVCVCAFLHVCVCVFPLPRVLITSDVVWRGMDPIRLVKQILQLLYGNFKSLSLMGVALGLICVMDTNPIRVS